jgi:aminocarboxymuconate-semialdehyde decarboxylase
MPYVAERADRGFEAYAECREHIARPPTEYFRRTYLDTVNFQPRALRLALDLMGADHIVLGTDFPHEVGNVRRALDTVRGLGLDAAAGDRILGGNAEALLKL